MNESDPISHPYRPGSLCCEACVFGRGAHAEWCSQRENSTDEIPTVDRDLSWLSNMIVISDDHAGCRMGLCPPHPIKLDDGGEYLPSPFQRKVYALREYFWDVWVPEATRGEEYGIVVNGDTMDGVHHDSVTQISHNLVDQNRIAYELLAPLVDRCKGRLWLIRGTEAHSGKSAAEEERLAERIGARPNAEGQYARWDLWKAMADGAALVHFLHHIGTTSSQAYESTAIHSELVAMLAESARWRRRPPDAVCRSHRHRYVETGVSASNETGDTGRAFGIVTPGWQGKMLALDTPIPTRTGWTTMGDVNVGDVLFDENGQPCHVTAVLPIDPRPESYSVTFSNNQVIKACGDHLWLTTAQVDRPGVPGGPGKRPLTRVRSTREIRETLRFGGGRINHSIPMPEGLHLPDAELPIDPYVLGCWLGDGDSDNARLTCDPSDAAHFAEEFNAAGFQLHRQAVTGGRCARYAIRRVDENRSTVPKGSGDNLQRQLRDTGLIGNKHIPMTYLRSSRAQRLALLQGLMDTDGYAENKGRVCEFSTTSTAIHDGICELLAGLGVKYTSVKKQVPNARNGAAWRVRFFVSPDVLPAFRMRRKLERLPLSSARRNSQRSRSVQIVSVEPCEPIPMRCIAVDSPSNLYRCGRTMLPTHNTPLAWRLAGARGSTPQFGGVLIRYAHGRLFADAKVWTVERSATE